VIASSVSVKYLTFWAIAGTANAANAIAARRLKSLRIEFIFVSPVGSDEKSSVRAIESCARRGRSAGEEVGWKCAIIRARVGDGNNFHHPLVQYMTLR
jgi:hypothetical protein